ncbi:uncharacterized protein BJ212DRAFT_1304326 [Suillus subaureus]|uniref:Uncharacterized protein n=1 Tax=Suillus subaureus TaxID=48587 RepID=A0A9P7J5Y9_9AGAM|nr:uncharacterized protein BJ212DRAFT_1304326 [Suillus subaureus]KAG1804306.1 hypothetical protein BJ212DRAFT_1304326 [Suillus subaureus]
MVSKASSHALSDLYTAELQDGLVHLSRIVEVNLNGPALHAIVKTILKALSQALVQSCCATACHLAWFLHYVRLLCSTGFCCSSRLICFCSLTNARLVFQWYPNPKGSNLHVASEGSISPDQQRHLTSIAIDCAIVTTYKHAMHMSCVFLQVLRGDGRCSQHVRDDLWSWMLTLVEFEVNIQEDVKCMHNATLASQWSTEVKHGKCEGVYKILQTDVKSETLGRLWYLLKRWSISTPNISTFVLPNQKFCLSSVPEKSSTLKCMFSIVTDNVDEWSYFELADLMHHIWGDLSVNQPILIENITMKDLAQYATCVLTAMPKTCAKEVEVMVLVLNSTLENIEKANNGEQEGIDFLLIEKTLPVAGAVYNQEAGQGIYAPRGMLIP